MLRSGDVKADTKVSGDSIREVKRTFYTSGYVWMAADTTISF